MNASRYCLCAHLPSVLALGALALQLRGAEPNISASTHRGWQTTSLQNGLTSLHILPEIGGRILQFKLGNHHFFWVNDQLAGKLPPSNGLAADGGWFNVGGDKLWPAPQGWSSDQEWPGPPDAVLDGQPYTLEKLETARGEAAVRLTSRKDPRSGVQFSRIVRIFEGTTRVSFEAMMKNIDSKPRRWGIWSHTQLDGARADGSGHNPLMQAWCPVNPRSRFPDGYSVIFGARDNPSFMIEPKSGLMQVQYKYQVGKIGLDSRAGWSAAVNGEQGTVFVQRFVFEQGKEYPDGSSVEFWLNGVGQIHAYNRDIAMSSNAVENPYVFESELLSPFAQLNPGESYIWRYEWGAANIGGHFPVTDCLDAGVVAEPFSADRMSDKVRLRGRFGVFAVGKLLVEFESASGRKLNGIELMPTVSPLAPVVLDNTVMLPREATAIRLVVVSSKETLLARTTLNNTSKGN